MRQNSDFNPQNFTQKVRKSQNNVFCLKFLQKTNKKSSTFCLYFFLFDHFLEAMTEMRAIFFAGFLEVIEDKKKFFWYFLIFSFYHIPPKKKTFIDILKYISLIIFGQNVWILVIVEMWLAWAGLKTTMHNI